MSSTLFVAVVDGLDRCQHGLEQYEDEAMSTLKIVGLVV